VGVWGREPPLDLTKERGVQGRQPMAEVWRLSLQSPILRTAAGVYEIFLSRRAQESRIFRQAVFLSRTPLDPRPPEPIFRSVVGPLPGTLFRGEPG
jgi:hypothetical protein